MEIDNLNELKKLARKGSVEESLIAIEILSAHQSPEILSFFEGCLCNELDETVKKALIGGFLSAGDLAKEYLYNLIYLSYAINPNYPERCQLTPAEVQAFIRPDTEIIADDLLHHPSVNVRHNASQALGYLGGDYTTKALLHAVEFDTDNRVRQSSAWSIGTLKLSEARDILLRILRTDDKLRGWVAKALAMNGGEGIFEELLKYYNQEKSPLTQWMLLESIKTLKDSHSLSLFKEVLNSELLGDQRCTALMGIYELLGEASLPILAEQIQDFSSDLGLSTVAETAIDLLKEINTEEAKTIVSNWEMLYRPKH